MDYKYIEQLLDRYWNCQTTLEEEEILRSFFSQDDIPVGLLKYKSLFAYETTSVKSDVLNEDFDEKVLAMVNDQQTTGRHISIMRRLAPLFRAAAVVCFFITLGGIVENSLSYRDANTKKSVAMEVKDSVSAADPALAYDGMATADSSNVVRN